MEALKLQHYLVIILILLTFASCNQEDKTEIITYNTSEFKEYVKNTPISLDEAWKIQLNFYKNNPKKMPYNLYKQNSAMYFIVDKYYVYTLKPLIKTKPKGKLLSGIWVNSITGEVRYINNDTIVQAESFSGWAK